METLRTTRSGLLIRVLALGLAATLFACVSKGRYTELETERDQLRSALETKSQELEAMESVNQDLEGQIEAQDVAIAASAATAATYSALAEDMRQELVAGQVVIEQLRDGIRVQMSDEVLFESGSAELDERGREILGSVSKQLQGDRYRVEVEGHTDSMPIGGRLAQRFPTNWDLAAARAARVVRLLEESGVKSERLVAVSYGSTRPIASNDDEAGRAQNRRIEIRLLPVDGSEPATGEEATE
jgi:chemotaxis protein MotB